MVASKAEQSELLHRLHELEGELLVLRERLDDRAAATPLPQGEFDVLCFVVGAATYGVELASVVEIVRFVRLTTLPDVSEAVMGAINVRGEVMPVIDARYRLVGRCTQPNLKTSIILIQGPAYRFGLAVDIVSVVRRVHSDALKEPNHQLSRMGCVAGVVTVATDVVQVLDVARLLSVHQWEAVNESIAQRENAVVAELEDK